MTRLRPIPGDPAAVRSEAGLMLASADHMREAARALARLADAAAYQSEAVDAFRANAADMVGVMTRAEIRYRATGEALADYAPKLDAAQQLAQEAVYEASGTDVDSAEWRVRRTHLDDLDVLAGPEEKARKQQEKSQAEHELAHQRMTLASAVEKHERAEVMRDQAATHAVTMIHEAERSSGLNDSFADDFNGFKSQYLDPAWDALKDAVVKVTTWVVKAVQWVADELSKFLQWVSVYLTIAAGVALVTGVGAPLAGVLMALAEIADYAALASDGISVILSGLRFLLGDLSGDELLAATIGLGVSAALTLIPGPRKAYKSGVDLVTGGGKQLPPHNVWQLPAYGDDVGDAGTDKIVDTKINNEVKGWQQDVAEEADGRRSPQSGGQQGPDFSTVDPERIVRDAFEGIDLESLRVPMTAGAV